MSDTERTTKTVTMTITATFYGDYIAANEVTGYLQYWIDAGFNDRDDLRTWDFGDATVIEVVGDPQGWDE